MQGRLPAIAACTLVLLALSAPARAGAPQPAQQQVAMPAAQRPQGETVAMQAGPRQAAAPAPSKADEDHPHRSAGVPMLLAAVALMTAIALRRWGAEQR